MKDRMTLRRRIAVTRRGYALLHRYCPGLAGGKAAEAFLEAIKPFLTIFLSARIVSELAGARDLRRLIVLASIAVLLNLLISLLTALIGRVCSNRESLMFSWFGKVFADKQMSMDYVDLECADIQGMRQRAEENLYMFGNGLGQLVWGIQGLVKAFVAVTASIALTVTLFTAKTGRMMFDSPIWIPVILGLIILGGYHFFRATERENRIFETWSENTVWFNRSFTFYGEELPFSQERAKDARLYQQAEAADRVMEELIAHNRDDDKPIHQMALYPALARLTIGAGNALCYLFVVVKALYGAFPVGQILQYVGALLQLGEGVQNLMFVMVDNGVYCRHLEALYAFLDLPNRKYQGTLPVEKRCFCDNGDNEYEFEFRNVSFTYPGSTEPALRDVSLRFHVGRRAALVGENGSGKTTLIKLLCRLYDPDEGEILLNGIDIRKYNYDEYLSLFSVIFQDFRLFSFSLGENVAASVQVDASRAEESLRRAGFGERLQELQEGLETPLYRDFDASGVELSGGEAQKVALARALYRNAPVMILDEPTAALDPVAETAVYEAFDELCADKTSIYISHRLSSCKFCDEILVLDKGRLIQRGTHADLLRDSDGKYYALWQAQAQYYHRT